MSQYNYKPSREKTPSFSSTLLDAIYRSIESENEEQFSPSGRKKELLRRETWTEKKKEVRSTSSTTSSTHHHEKVFLRRKSMEYVQDYGDNYKKESNSMFLKNSSWSSSDSGFSGGLSSSEAEFLQHVGNSKSSNYSMQRLKPIRTSLSSYQESRNLELRAERNDFSTGSENKAKHEADNFVKMKLRALKIYGDLKKAKQPISPGGRLASFVNSLFTTGHNGNKKGKKLAQYEDEGRKSKSTNGSTCSSASSFSRSCLSKTPSSSSTKDQVKRSVRFCPVNVILDDDDDDRDCGAKSLYHQSDYSLKSKADSLNNKKKEFKFVVRDESFMIKNDIRELLKKYHQKGSGDYMNGISDNENRDEDEDDDDAASYASSDLFELDSLACNGLERYTEELPVYETTYLDTNRLASGLMV